jgi:hypothetical protein
MSCIGKCNCPDCGVRLWVIQKEVQLQGVQEFKANFYGIFAVAPKRDAINTKWSHGIRSSFDELDIKTDVVETVPNEILCT